MKDYSIEMDIRTFTIAETKLAETILREKILKFGSFFELRNKKLSPSPFYLDFRAVTLNPQALLEIVSVYENMTKNLDFDYYVAVPSAVSGLAYILTFKTGIPALPVVKTKNGPVMIIDKSSKGFKKQERVVIFDDVITSGESAKKVGDLLESAGFKVEWFVFFLDREQGGKEKLEKEGYKVKSKFKISELLNLYFYKMKAISKLEYKSSMAYIADNKI